MITLGQFNRILLASFKALKVETTLSDQGPYEVECINGPIDPNTVKNFYGNDILTATDRAELESLHKTFKDQFMQTVSGRFVHKGDSNYYCLSFNEIKVADILLLDEIFMRYCSHFDFILTIDKSNDACLQRFLKAQTELQMSMQSFQSFMHRYVAEQQQEQRFFAVASSNKLTHIAPPTLR